MNEKINEMANKYPEEYREQIAEILRLRQDSNDMKAARGNALNETLEQYEARMLSHLVSAPDKWNRSSRTNEVSEMLETARRVNAKYHAR